LAAGAISALTAGEVGIIGASAGIASAIGVGSALNRQRQQPPQQHLPEPRYEDSDLDDEEFEEAVRLALRIMRKRRNR
jgi:hypothetical protein